MSSVILNEDYIINIVNVISSTRMCDLAHRRSVAALCMLHKIRCKLMHPLYYALPEPYAPVRVTCGAVIAHRYTSYTLRYTYTLGTLYTLSGRTGSALV